MNVYIRGAKDYSAMRGPCQEGFHIPTKDEWVGVNSIMTALGNTTVSSYISVLHLHLGRFIEWQGTKYPDEPQIGYWSCTKYANNNYAYALFLYTYNGTEIVSPNQQFQKNRGFPIRPFKDTFVTPTASWTVIQGALGSAGIFWNKTEGIISITGDGTTGYTITDKDLGATTVYNNGNTKTDANCGKCYQWGNNYGFVFSSGLTTSGTQVNASSYGPGNYYSSSTFVTADPRDSSNNANLWGGATGIVSLAKLKQAYIGDCSEWKPGANTVAYYKFDGNMNDSSGNNRNLSVAQGTFTYGTLSGGAKYIQTNFNSYSSQISSFPFNSNSATISFWMSFVNGTAGNGNTSLTYGATVFDLVGSNNVLRPVLSWLYNSSLRYGFGYLNTVNQAEFYVPSVSESWHLYTIVCNGGTASIYIDGVLRKTGTYTVQNGYSFRLNTVDGDSTQRRDYSSRDKLSELIFENKQWTAQEVQDYYNKTKSLYGIS